MNDVVASIVARIFAEELAAKAHGLRLAYLAGYITKRELQDALLLLGEQS